LWEGQVQGCRVQRVVWPLQVLLYLLKVVDQHALGKSWCIQEPVKVRHDLEGDFLGEIWQILSQGRVMAQGEGHVFSVAF
jgi:hypothetical protein